jgi:trehalose/maltose hydrolase-like predicted phosphorylase
MGACLLVGCSRQNAAPVEPTPPNPNEMAARTNQQFLDQKTFDPWVLTTTDPRHPIDAYLANGRVGYRIRSDGSAGQRCEAGMYKNSTLVVTALPASKSEDPAAGTSYRQSLDLRTGTLTTTYVMGSKEVAQATRVAAVSGGQGADSALSVTRLASGADPADAPLPFWKGRDIGIEGDPEAQQVTHASLFYLLSSTYPGSSFSIPPMGLSSGGYNGHIFWDADVWMLPALLVQYPEYARSIVDYRFKTLGQARKNARLHGFQGAEYPWESAATGEEVAPAEFARERHVTADVAFAAWQVYLWTGDRTFLVREGWPILQATANYWASRVTRDLDGKFHIRGVISPDETAGSVDDDAYTNAAVIYNLRAAISAARMLRKPAPASWSKVASALAIPFDRPRGVPAPSDTPLTEHYQSKQAATLLLLYPLGMDYDRATQGKMLDFYAAHTIKTGPAMTASIHAVIAARLDRGSQSLEYFRAAYRPFMRAPWDAFAEKRTTQNVYFLTGMAGCVQSVLYGFAGLHVSLHGEHAVGTKLAGDGEAALYADPHLPSGWNKLVIRGIHFRGHALDLTISAGNRCSRIERPSS